MKKVDYLIIGGGLAGVQMALQCELNGSSYHIIDDPSSLKCSYKAAGIINPVTGRHYVKSWNIDALLQDAIAVYGEWSQLLGRPFLQKLEIRRVLGSIGEENRWNERLLDERYQRYLDPEWSSSCVENGLLGDEKVVRLKEAYRLDIPGLIKTSMAYFIEKETWSHGKMDWVSFDPEAKSYKNISFKTMVFCRGAYDVDQPFDFLPIRPNMGEVFFIKIDSPEPIQYAIKKKLFVVPVDEEWFWVGGRYSVVDRVEVAQPDYPTMEKMLQETLALPYEIVEKTYGVRPTVPDRKPLLGRHPKWNHIALFNGLGTKGASLSPFAAKHMYRYLEYGETLPEELDLRRYI